MKIRQIAVAALILVLLLGLAAFVAGTLLTAPHPREIGSLPSNLTGETVEFPSESGSQIHGWFLPGRASQGVVVVMHGVRACRLDMLDRAEFLSAGGYAVLVFDFQAHGESPGKQITFGYLESRDARAAVAFARSRSPDEKVGVIGVSMGGAAAMLAEPPLQIDALVLEQVYPALREAIGDRISMRLGNWSRILTPFLSWQLGPRLGVRGSALRPIDHAAKLPSPKLFIGGSADRHTTPAELEKMFEAAAEPKELWIVPRAQHVDLCRFGKAEYQTRILEFLSRSLRRVSKPAGTSP
ncbi:MAG TPA: alpha/beta fold hydrolase [Chthoniobacterales bacterium]|nr:alpha/beta fold hydrolase [Chthoniobacterales bacterium]